VGVISDYLHVRFEMWQVPLSPEEHDGPREHAQHGARLYRRSELISQALVLGAGGIS
jgi:hypothetical protein